MRKTSQPLSWPLRAPSACTADQQLTGAARGPLPDDVTQLAVADKGTLCVLAVPLEADVGVQVTLVHICGMTR